jgi:hypothetical protein
MCLPTSARGRVGMHAELRHNLEHVLDTRRLSWLRILLDQNSMPSMWGAVAP